MFAMLYLSKYKDAATAKQAGKKKMGRHTGASPAAHLLHRNDKCSSDLPFFINSILFTMLHNEQMPVPALQELEALLLSGESNRVHDSLNTMFCEFVMSQTEYDHEQRSEITLHYRILRDILQSLNRKEEVAP